MNRLEAIKQGIHIINTEELTKDMLNDVYGTVKICGYDYDAGRALEEVDPVAFNEVVNNYIDARLFDGDIVELDDGGYVFADELPDDDGGN